MWLASPENQLSVISDQFSVDNFNSFRSTAAGETVISVRFLFSLAGLYAEQRADH
jgi:hypothetical protein